MNNCFLKNKFLLGMSVCTMLFSLGNSSVLAQNRKPITTTPIQIAQVQTETRNATLPNRQLVDAIRKHTINSNYSDVKYSFFEVDLNNDGNKDAIVFETGSHCGMAMCYLQIFAKIGNNYKLVSERNSLPTYNSKVAILKDTNSGWINIALPVVNYNIMEYDKAEGWRIYKFNRSEYEQTGVLNSINKQILIDFENSKIFNLGN